MIKKKKLLSMVKLLENQFSVIKLTSYIATHWKNNSTN